MTRRHDLIARSLLTLAAILPYWRFLTFRVIFITDDYFASDIFHGELPGRVLLGQLIRQGQWPTWTTTLCSGLPLVGAPMDPIGLAAFALLPPAPALDTLVIAFVLIAAHGAYSLARRIGADRSGAVLAGTAFAGCGYLACQLKHLAIVSTVVWLPVGLVLLDGVFVGDTATAGRRARRMAAFGLVFAQQVLSGFPQSAYICALVYAAFALFRAIEARQSGQLIRVWFGRLAGTGAAAVLGATAGAIVLLPLSALGSISDRVEGLSYDWSTRLAYWLPNVWMFLFPYANGDISNATYQGPPFFWEDYGYVGLATFLLAIYAARERRRPAVMFTIALTVLAYLCVLGRATPVFHVLYLVLPGMRLFRFPTRFLIVVDLGLALLAAVGLTRLREALSRFSPAPSLVPAVAVGSVCALTALDLFVHQPRQNPIVPAREWLAAPPTVDVLHRDTPDPRTFTPRHRDVHRVTFAQAHGWADVQPYFELRDTLEPNTGGIFWGTPSADCYAGIAPRWSVDVWGDHNRELSIAGLLTAIDTGHHALMARPELANVLRTFGVTHVLSLYEQHGAALIPLGRVGSAFVYRVDGTARARFVSAARLVATDRDAALRLMDPGFDPDKEILLHDAPSTLRPIVGSGTNVAGGSARIVSESGGSLTIDATAPTDGFLLLADTFYPGWTATVDERPTPIYRANLSVRGIPLARGHHSIRFTYEPPRLRLGALVTACSLVCLAIWAAGAVYTERRARR